MRKLTTLGLLLLTTMTSAQALTLNDLNKVELSLGYGLTNTQHYTYTLLQNHFHAQAALDLGNVKPQLANFWAGVAYSYSTNFYKEIKNDTTDGLAHLVTLQDWNKNQHTFNLSKSIHAQAHTIAAKLGYTFHFHFTPQVSVQPYLKVGLQHLEVNTEYHGLPDNTTLFYPNQSLAMEFDDDITIIKGISPNYGAGIQLNYGRYGVGLEYTRTHYQLHHELTSYLQNYNSSSNATMSKATDYLMGFVSYRF